MLAVADNVLRLINFCFLVICLGLASALINTQTHSISRVNYCLFTAAYGIATDSVYGIFANFFEVLAWPAILFTLDFLNFAFTLTAGSVIAVGTRTHSCSNKKYLESNRIVQNSGNRCRMAQCYTAFVFFSMGIFLVKMIMSAINVFQNGAFTAPKFGRRRRGGVAEVGVPSISQV